MIKIEEGTKIEITCVRKDSCDLDDRFQVWVDGKYLGDWYDRRMIKILLEEQ